MNTEQFVDEFTGGIKGYTVRGREGAVTMIAIAHISRGEITIHEPCEKQECDNPNHHGECKFLVDSGFCDCSGRSMVLETTEDEPIFDILEKVYQESF